MGVYTTIPALMKGQEARFKRALASMDKTHRFLATEGKKDFQRQNTGTIPTRRLRQMKHPYARAGSSVPNAGRGAKVGRDWRSHGIKGQVRKSGMVRTLPINRQTGRLFAGIKLEGPAGRHKKYKLYSSAPHAKYVLAVRGTKKMVARGLLGENGYLRRAHKLRKHVLYTELRKAQRSP